jgi:hypothetical protein
LPSDERDFLVAVAGRVLGTATTAATTAAGLTALGIDAKRVDTLIPWHSVAFDMGGFVLKKVEPALEAPANFGLFVKRRAT